jgi:rare lipoprotein A
LKSFLKMLLVAGVFAVSLGVMQDEAQAELMVASWYGPGFEGAVTASGDIYNYGDYTAASPYLPFGTELLVSYGGYSVVVVVNDRGPYVYGRELDLSQAAAEAIGLTYVGTDVVDVEVLGY